MSYTVSEVKQFVRDNDVKFVKLTFCDIMGKQKNVSVVASELDEAFGRGIPIDSPSPDYRAAAGKPLYLVPDPGTLYLLPWRPQSGRVISMLCDIRNADGTPFEGDSRSLLSKAVKRSNAAVKELAIGTSCEFYALRTDADGEPTFVSADNAGFLDAAPLDRCENIRRDIILNLETMGISPVSSHHERGKGQNRIVFKSSEPMTAAKNLLVFKSAVRNICVRDGAYATFMPKPFDDDYGSGMRIAFSFGSTPEKVRESFIEGVLRRIREIAAFTNPSTNSYRRLSRLDAAKRIAWSETEGSLLRRDGAGEYTLCCPDATCNPYIVLALLICAGADGAERGDKLRAEGESDAGKDGLFPETLGEALTVAEKSEFVSRVLPKSMLDRFFEAKRREADEASDLGSERKRELDC